MASAVLTREFDGSAPTIVHGGKGDWHIAARKVSDRVLFLTFLRAIRLTTTWKKTSRVLVFTSAAPKLQTLGGEKLARLGICPDTTRLAHARAHTTRVHRTSPSVTAPHACTLQSYAQLSTHRRDTERTPRRAHLEKSNFSSRNRTTSRVDEARAPGSTRVP